MKDRIFNAFDQIHAEEALIEKTLEGMYSYRAKKERRAFFSRRGMALATSFALMLCIGVTGWQSYFTEAFALTVDVNPSIEMSVNRFDRVISTKGFNSEGEEVISSVDVKYMNYADAIDSVLEEEKKQGYLEDDGEVLVAVVAPKKEKAVQVKETIDTAQAAKPQNVVVVQPKKAAVKEAQKHDMSAGKYQAYLDIQEVSPEVTVDEVKEMPVKEIATIMKNETGTSTETAKTPSSEGSGTTSSSNAGAVTGSGTSSESNSTTSSNAGTNANTSATPNKDTSTNAGTSANTGATPNKGTNTGTSANTGATPNADKKPASNTNSSTDGSANKAPAASDKENTSDKNTSDSSNAAEGSGTVPAVDPNKDNASDVPPTGDTNTQTAPSGEPSADAGGTDSEVAATETTDN